MFTIRHLLTTFFVLLTCVSFSQRWLQAAGSFGRDEMNGMCLAQSGNLFTTGIYSGNATFDNIALTHQGNSDFLLLVNHFQRLIIGQKVHQELELIKEHASLHCLVNKLQYR